MYGAPSTDPPLSWGWVDDQLSNAGVYWAVAKGTGHPHPRPVWGVWSDESLYLSIGSPPITSALEVDGDLTVHLGGAIDVVIVEGSVVGHIVDSEIISAYDRKYDWDYDVDEYGSLTVVRPAKVIAWRSAGWAGREGFRQTGRWRFESAG